MRSTEAPTTAVRAAGIVDESADYAGGRINNHAGGWNGQAIIPFIKHTRVTPQCGTALKLCHGRATGEHRMRCEGADHVGGLLRRGFWDPGTDTRPVRAGAAWVRTALRRLQHGTGAECGARQRWQHLPGGHYHLARLASAVARAVSAARL